MKPAMDIDAELHRILGAHGIASLSARDHLAGLPDALIKWAADACRQTQSAEVAGLTTRLATLEQELRDVDEALDGEFTGTTPSRARAVQQQRVALDDAKDRAEAAEARVAALEQARAE